MEYLFIKIFWLVVLVLFVSGLWFIGLFLLNKYSKIKSEYWNTVLLRLIVFGLFCLIVFFIKWL
jgi:hypothetical protein